MYIIKYENSFPTSKGGWTASYFSRFGVYGLREYGSKKDARRFESRKEAQLFIKQMLDNRSGHKVIKVED